MKIPKLVVALVVGSFLVPTTNATEVKWTPNKEEEAPLPLSMKQRQQLLQLEQAIKSAPDPNKVLQQVSEANGMSPQDLMSMIERNSRDLQQDPSLARPTSLPTMIFKFIMSVGVAIANQAKRHPRSFGLVTLATICAMWTLIALPRTGIMISRGPGLLSKAPTTVFAPPSRLLTKILESPRIEQQSPSVASLKTSSWDDLTGTPGEVTFHQITRRHPELVQAVTAHAAIEAESFLEEEEEEEGIYGEKLDVVLDLLFENAASALSSRVLTEFIDAENPTRLRYVASADARKKYGVLVVKGLGDWGRYGLVYLQASKSTETSDTASLTMSTVRGGNPFDGQIHLSVEKVQSKNELVIQVHCAIPKKGRKLSKKIGTHIVQGLAESLRASTERRTQLALARRLQSSRFQGSAHKRAKERRHSRFVKEKELEEMAADRRRRKHRQNPDAGRYRPSGIRQRSPDNAVY